MIKAEPAIALPPSHQQALQRAVMNLENQDLPRGSPTMRAGRSREQCA
jgi:hypothetical protein